LRLKRADIASISGGFPPFIFEYPLNFETLQLIFPYALIMASGLTEGVIDFELGG
jgi:SulP family sulfate permease